LNIQKGLHSFSNIFLDV